MYAGAVLPALGGSTQLVTVRGSMAAHIYLFNVRRWLAAPDLPVASSHLRELQEDLAGVAADGTPDDFDRYPPMAQLVNASPDPAYLFVSASRTTAAFQAWCRKHAIAYRAWSDGGFTVVRPATKVTPGMVPATVLG